VTSSRDNEPATDAADEPRTRRQLLTAGGLAAIAGVLGAVGVSSGAAAKDGQFVRLGQKNKGTRTTSLQAARTPGLLMRVTRPGAAIRGITPSEKGAGVQGWADAKKGKTIGLAGRTESPDGVAGQFVANRGGTAVLATSAQRNGVALRTQGKLQFEQRSGEATTSGGAEFVIPVGGGLTKRSLVLATLQDHFPGVHVEAASVLETKAGSESILVRLNQSVPEPARVAWLILD
jgi:hypothetical protein